MKRSLALLIAIVALTTFFGYAEGVDYSSISTDELLAISETIQSELDNRGYSPELYTGRYIVGTDIVAGRYILKTHSDSEVSPYDVSWKIWVYKTETSEEEFNRVTAEYDNAYNQAARDHKDGKEYSYPVEPSYSQYYEFYTLSGNSKITVMLKDGEVLKPIAYSSESGPLFISKHDALFVE